LGKLSSRALGLAGLTLVAPGVLLAQDAAPPEHYRLRLEYVYWMAEITGEVQKGATEEVGRVDLKDDLGVEDENLNEFRAVLRLGSRHKLRASWISLDYDGDVVLDRLFIFDGTIFRQGERTVTSMKGDLWSAEYEWDFLQNSAGHLGLVIGAKYLDVDSVIVQPEVGRRETGTQRAPVPVIGLSGRLYVGRLSFSAEGTGLTIGSRGSLYDVEGQARFHISDRLAVGGGYRWLRARGEEDDDFLLFSDQGFRFGVELSL
jgi:hypothetical protein